MSGTADLLTIARALMSVEPEAAVDASLATDAKVKLLSPSAMRVFEDTLRKGSVHMLARLGGAANVIRPDTGATKPARAYDVRAAPALSFGKYTFQLVRWLARTPLGQNAVTPFVVKPETLGDELVAYLALRLVAGKRFETTVAVQPGIAGSLAWLGFARAIARNVSDAPPPDFEALLASADGRLVVECLAGDLALRWAKTAAWGAREILELDVAARIAARERTVLDSFVDAAKRVDRWDLATFLVDAAQAIVPPGARTDAVAARVAPPVRPGGTLRARTEARQRSGALFHVLPRLARRYEELALVSFIDDGYDVAQATLSSWSRLGRDGFARGAAVVSELASIDAFAAATPR